MMMTPVFISVLPVFLALTGCSGPNDETLLSELRVLSLVMDPPEAQPETTATVTATVVDPAGEGAVGMLWTCTQFGEECVEAALPAQGAVTADPLGSTLSAEIALPAVLADVVRDGETVLPIPVWMLACAPGLCDVIDQVQAAPGTADAAAAAAFLQDPFTGMESLPLVGTSLAFGLLRVSLREEPVRNPVISGGPDTCAAEPGGEVAINLDVSEGSAAGGALSAWGYATAGGFGMAGYDVRDGIAEMSWFAPGGEDAPADEVVPESADLYVVVTGEEGGSALWQIRCSIG